MRIWYNTITSLPRFAASNVRNRNYSNQLFNLITNKQSNIERIELFWSYVFEGDTNSQK